MQAAVAHCFYALGFGLGFAMSLSPTPYLSLKRSFCASVSGWALRSEAASLRHARPDGRFYALGFGLGFAMLIIGRAIACFPFTFLCPRFRAGLCDLPSRPSSTCLSSR